MGIYRPKVVMKSKPTRAGDREHGAEVICLHEEDYNHHGDPDFFPIKLAYNGIHHYLPIVQRSVANFMDDYNSAIYHLVNARYKLKKLKGHLPEGCTFQKVAQIAHAASVTTTAVLSGCNPLVGTTGAAGAAPITLFDFPRLPSDQPPPPGRKRRRGAAAATAAPVEPGSSTSTAADPGDDPEEIEGDNEPDPGPSVTITHDRQLKKADNQCFCGQSDFNSSDELLKHKQDVHIHQGGGKNPKTGKPFDSWLCSTCGEKCSDNRACWKHFRTQHLGLYIHYCPVEGCGKGNDQKDTIVSHIKKEHKDQTELIILCNQQAFLKCRNCKKVFSSVKGKNQHEDTCGLPKTKKNCPFEKCFKTYQSQDRMDQHIATAHEGKGHKCLCPVCGASMSSQQSLDIHLRKQHNQE